jgi:hypothetical protein
VRRVGNQLALSARRFLERAEHGVEAVGQPAQLVTSADLDPLGEIARLGDVLGRCGETPNGGECRSGDRQPERGRDGDATPSDQDQQVLDSAE